MHFNVLSKYFYSQLESKEKEVYKKILAGWYSYKNKIVLYMSCSKIDFHKVFLSIKEDIPELFYVDFNSISVDLSIHKAIISGSFFYSKEEIEKTKSKIINTINTFRIKNENNRDMERCIHDYLAKSINYSTNVYAEEAHSIYGAFINRTAVCEGYARAFKLMCDEMHIPCIVVSGISKNSLGHKETHAWNIVRDKNTNYHVDVTWDSCLYKHTDIPLYYNVSDMFISNNHFWDKTNWPSCNKSGKIENRMITVISFKSFSDSLQRMISLKKDSVIFKFKKKFTSTKEIMTIINKILQENAITVVTSFSAYYIPELDCAIINIDY